MTSDIIIREYQDDDLDCVIALARELQSHEIQFEDRFKPAIDVGAAHVENILLDVTKHKGTLLLAIFQKDVVGFVAYFGEVASEDEPTYKHHIFAQVEYLIVSGKVRGMGVGKILLDKCEKIARAQDRAYLQLNVLSKNVEARRFYAREGFEDSFVKMEKKLL